MKNEDLKKILDFIKTPKGKAVLFFAIYFIFFLFIGVVFKSSGSTSLVDDNNSSFDFNLESITNNNYKFTFNILVDDKEIIYNGIRYDDREDVTKDSSIRYYREKDNFFIDSNGVWIKSENPYLYNEFYNSDNISSLLASASYVSKTEYDSGKVVYNFSISSASINKLFEENDLDVEEIPNELIVSVDEYGYVNKIKFNLASYCKVKNICVNNMVIDLFYDEYGKVEEIISPLK